MVTHIRHNVLVPGVEAEELGEPGSYCGLSVFSSIVDVRFWRMLDRCMD